MFKKLFAWIKSFFVSSPLAAEVLIKAAASRAFIGRPVLARKTAEIISKLRVVQIANLSHLHEVALRYVENSGLTVEERAIIDILLGSVQNQIANSVVAQHISESDALLYADEVLGWIFDETKKYTDK